MEGIVDAARGGEEVNRWEKKERAAVALTL